MTDKPVGAGYLGYDNNATEAKKIGFLGKEIEYFTSSHERSHLLCTYGMSPFEQGQPCYALVWEGTLGHFYEIDEHVKIIKLGKVLEDPGKKYSFLFSLADPTTPSIKGYYRFSDAGKLMALTAFSDRKSMIKEEKEVIDYILDHVTWVSNKEELEQTLYFNIGVEHPEFKNLAGKFSNALFDRFYNFAKARLNKGYPLLIAGGCGLNCEWNTKWKDCGLFSNVFVPPCTNDSGSAIGSGIDAQLYYTGSAKISWSVYAGETFIHDVPVPLDEFIAFPLNYQHVVSFLSQQNVIAWVQGRYEIGPRALGNRSLLAAPFKAEMHDRLNIIKQREQSPYSTSLPGGRCFSTF